MAQRKTKRQYTVELVQVVRRYGRVVVEAVSQKEAASLVAEMLKSNPKGHGIVLDEELLGEIEVALVIQEK